MPFHRVQSKIHYYDYSRTKLKKALAIIKQNPNMNIQEENF